MLEAKQSLISLLARLNTSNEIEDDGRVYSSNILADRSAEPQSFNNQNRLGRSSKHPAPVKMAQVPKGVEVIDISSDGESVATFRDGSDLNFQHNELFGLFDNRKDSENNILRELFPEIGRSASPGPTRKKRRAVNPFRWPDIADSPVESIDLSNDDFSPASSYTSNTSITPSDIPKPEMSSEDACLARILELFPDISHQHVRELYNHHKNDDLTPGRAESRTIENIIEDILQNPPYPKQRDAKRKRTPESDDETQWKADADEPWYFHRAGKILRREFPLVPAQYIRQVMEEKKTLFSTYMTLSASEKTFNNGSNGPYERLKKARRAKGNRPLSMEDILPVQQSLERELDAAKKKAAKEADSIRRQKELEDAERLNEEEHTRTGALVECQCCFTDAPANRAIPCDGANAHFFCFSCIKNGAEAQIGIMKYEMKCFDVSGCSAGFNRSRLSEAVGPSVMAKLESLQQQDEIAKAGIEGLEDCPFCEFKAICPPVAEDREFRCRNPECERVSCRLCQDETHVPKTCEEAKKERGIPERHLVEEAMSEALIRTCPRCKVKIVKEMGCNKMTCIQCRCIMCYICKKDITREGYNHFGTGPGACQVHDNSGSNRHQDEVERAERAAIEKIRAENPNLGQDELRVNRPEDKKDKKAARHNNRNRMGTYAPPGAMAAHGLNRMFLLNDMEPYPQPVPAGPANYAPILPGNPMPQFAGPVAGVPNPNMGIAPQLLEHRPMHFEAADPYRQLQFDLLQPYPPVPFAGPPFPVGYGPDMINPAMIGMFNQPAPAAPRPPAAAPQRPRGQVGARNAAALRAAANPNAAPPPPHQHVHVHLPDRNAATNPAAARPGAPAPHQRLRLDLPGGTAATDPTARIQRLYASAPLPPNQRCS
ncbi:hypothetical protein VTN00DRAFT_3903 [Thermoascus crustaceus]|uniref:uncharacterized protein n=1 Tax=Thermoascus crustaceus TaxID=5088 RepID=UPI003741FDD2